MGSHIAITSISDDKHYIVFLNWDKEGEMVKGENWYTIVYLLLTQ